MKQKHKQLHKAMQNEFVLPLQTDVFKQARSVHECHTLSTRSSMISRSVAMRSDASVVS